MKNKHKEITSLCNKLDIPLYQKILLIEMVYRKLKHPAEEIDELIDKVKCSTVPKQYRKLAEKSCMQKSINKEKEQLEEELHDCGNLPEDLFKGDIVENTVRYYYEAVCGVE